MTDQTPPTGGILNPDTGAKGRTIVRTVAGLTTAVLATLTATEVADLSVATAVVAGVGLALEQALHRLTYGGDA